MKRNLKKIYKWKKVISLINLEMIFKFKNKIFKKF